MEGWSGIQGSEIDPALYGNLAYNKDGISNHWSETDF